MGDKLKEKATQTASTTASLLFYILSASLSNYTGKIAYNIILPYDIPSFAALMVVAESAVQNLQGILSGNLTTFHLCCVLYLLAFTQYCCTKASPIDPDASLNSWRV